MEMVAVERESDTAHFHVIMTYLFCLVFEEYSNPRLENQGCEDGSADALRELASSGFQEARAGAHTQHLFQTRVAKNLA